MNFYQFSNNNLILCANEENRVFVAWNYNNYLYVFRGDDNGNIVRTTVRESVLPEESQNLYCLQRQAGDLFRHYLLNYLD